MKESDIKLEIVDHVGLRMNPQKRAYVIADSFLGTKDNFQGIIANVKVTHAGRPTLNNMIYLPSKVMKGMQTFVSPYEKPIGAHHKRDRLQEEDAIGRVKKVSYVKSDLPKAFSKYFNDSINVIEDSSRDIHDVIEVIRDLAKHPIFYDRMFPGFGYVQSAGHIGDYDAAQKIMDGRYLTASVRAGSNAAFCLVCDHDWGSAPCEHELGEMVDGVKVSLITDELYYRGYDYVNEPADELAHNVSVNWPNQETNINQHVNQVATQRDSVIYELSSSPLVISDSVLSNEEFHKYIGDQNKSNYKVDLSSIPKDITVLAVDAEARKLTVMTSPDPLDGHTHVAEVSLDGNGGTKNGNSPLYDHEHMIEKWYVESYEDEESGYRSTHDIWRSGPLMLVEANDNTHKQEKSDTIKEASDNITQARKGMKEKNSDTTTEAKERTVIDVLDALCSDDANKDDFSVSDEDRDLIYNGMKEYLVEDAELSTEKRKSLPKSAFCGPDRSFPVPDCAHVTAARRLIGRYKGEGSKEKIRACVNRKAKAMGCDSEDSVEDTENKINVEDQVQVNVLNDDFVIDDQVSDETLQKSFTKIEKAMVDRSLKVDVYSGRIDKLENTVTELEDNLKERDTQLGYLREELKLSYNESTAINERIIAKDSKLREVLCEVLAFCNEISDSDNKFDPVQTVEQSTDNLIKEYQSKFLSLNTKELSAKINDGTTVVTDSEKVEDPTLQNDEENTDTSNESKTELKGIQADVYGKAKDIYDSNGSRSTVGYLKTLISNDIISVDFGEKVMNLLNVKKDAS